MPGTGKAACASRAETTPLKGDTISFRDQILPLFLLPLTNRTPPCVVCHSGPNAAQAGNLVLGGDGVNSEEVYASVVTAAANDPIVPGGMRIDCSQPERSLLVVEATLGKDVTLIEHPASGKAFIGLNDHFAVRIIAWIEQGAKDN